jgi:transposase-like protein
MIATQMEAMNGKVKVQRLGLDNIKVDPGLQSRAGTNPEYMRQFTEAMLRGEVFPPLATFFDGNVYWLADGFHRHGAARRAGFKDFRCEIHHGSRRDAIIYSAGANKAFSVPRTDEDKKKAFYMLASDDEWFEKTYAELARHIGVVSATAMRWHREFCVEKGLEQRPARERVEFPKFTKTKVGSYVATIAGKTRYLGKTEFEAKKKAREIIKREESTRESDISPLNAVRVKDYLVRKGIPVRTAGNAPRSGLGQVLILGNVAACFNEIVDFSNVDAFVGRMFLNKAKNPGVERLIVVSRVAGNSEAHDLAARLGIEFMALADFLGGVRLAEPAP